MQFKIQDPREFIKQSNPPYSQVVATILANNNVMRAVKYISPKEVVRATRRSFRIYNRKTRKGQSIEILLHIGRPNYLEREFIALCQKAKEPFPIKRIQLKLWNPPKKKLKKINQMKTLLNNN